MKGRTIYCHFAFKRKKGTNFGYFATTFFADKEGKQKILNITRKLELWEDQQYVTAIQSYENVLSVIYENQALMMKANIRQVMLVTNNSVLCKWIMNPKKNKYYMDYMEEAYKMYCVGAPKEITLGVGLCEPYSKAKAYNYCKEDYVERDIVKKADKKSNKKHRIVLGNYDSILDVIDKDTNIPRIDNIQEEV